MVCRHTPGDPNCSSSPAGHARALADILASGASIEDALKAYEAERLPVTTEIVQQNRGGGPERVIDVVEARAPDGFDDLHAIASHDELEAIVKGYSSLAGFEKDQVNK